MTITYPTDYLLPLQREVALFHDSFGMPNRLATPGPLPADRIQLRIGLLEEEGVVELTEAIEKDDTVAIIDALIDTVYVALGALVEMGEDAGAFLHVDGADYFEAFNQEVLVELAKSTLAGNKLFLRMLARAFHKEDAHRSVVVLQTIVAGALLPLTRSGLDPRPFFDEVQRANMSKLDADGQPVHSRGMELDGYPVGKVLKGANYIAPDLAAVFEHVLQAKVSHRASWSEFERGVRLGTEAMIGYFLDEDEGPLYAEIPKSLLDSFETSAIADVLRDEKMRTTRAAG